jgi:hypothetical protein
VSTEPEVGETLLIFGVTVKVAPLLAWPLTVTTTGPVVALEGTGTAMLVALQLVGVAVVPLKVTVLVPCVAPNVVPEIVTAVSTGPEVGETLFIFGVTVKLTPLLAWPLTVTITGPVVAPAGTGTAMLVALQLVGVAAFPLKVTVLVPCVAPNVVPLMVTDVLTAPRVGERLFIFGVTVKAILLLEVPWTDTTTGPVVAAAGTGATILPALHEVGVAVTPLKVSVLLPWVEPKFAPLTVIEVPTGPEVAERLLIDGGVIGSGTTTKES